MNVQPDNRSGSVEITGGNIKGPVVGYNEGSINYITMPEPRPGVPTCPLPYTDKLFGRSAIIDEVVQRLTDAGGVVAISALRGLPGIGKTDLLRFIGCDTRVVAHFTGGVLYAELGPHADAATILRRWLLELNAAIPQTDDPAQLVAAVRQTLIERPALMILDDVWQASLRSANVLRECLMPRWALLVSSRAAEIARRAAKDTPPLTLPPLDDDPALALVRRHAARDSTNPIDDDPQNAAALVQALGNLPLALKLAGHWVRRAHHDPAPCATLLRTWHQRLDHLRGDETRPGRSEDELSLDAIIALSYDALADETRTLAAASAVFGPTPLDWDWPALLAVWGRTHDIALAHERALLDSGLLEYNDATRRYSLHQTVHAFLDSRRQQPDHSEPQPPCHSEPQPPRHSEPQPSCHSEPQPSCHSEPQRRISPVDEYTKRHALYYAALMERCADQLQHESTLYTALAILDREIGQIERGQAWAVAATDDQTLIDYAFACRDYFNWRGRYEQWIEWCEAGRAAAARLRQTGNEAGLLGNLGIVAQSQGRYDAAIDSYQQSLAITQRIGDDATTARQLVNLGNVAAQQGRYDEAIDSYQQSLEIKRRIGDVAGEAATLGNLGNVAAQQGRYDEAIDYYEQSLEITRRIGDDATTARQLGNLGIVARLQGRYDAAIDCYQQSLEITDRIGDVATSSMISWNLGTLYHNQGDLVAALPLMERGATWYEQIGHPDAAELRTAVEQVRSEMMNDE